MKLIHIFFLSLFLSFSISAANAKISGYANNKEVNKFINEMVKKHKFKKRYLESLFANAKVYDSILEAIARPAEGKPWYEYRPIFVTKARTQGGINFWKKNAAALARAEKKYGVPQEIIVAIIGVETRYGKHAGRYPVFDALATLAFGYPPRAKFFRSELEQFLLMIHEEQMDSKDLLGSYAGAMGMPQFISSSFRRYAVDFDGDGKRDLWNSIDDVIGSVANYFSEHGWIKGASVTFPVTVTDTSIVKGNKLKPYITVDELEKKGVKIKSDVDGKEMVTLLKFEGKAGDEYWIGLKNFYVITRYNHNEMYAMAVFQLSERFDD